MRVIHKFGPFQPHEVIRIENIRKVVHFDQQGHGLYVWAELDKEGKRNREVALLVVGTGWDYECEWEHVSTVVDSTQLVWHLLKEKNWIHDTSSVFGG